MKIKESGKELEMAIELVVKPGIGHGDRRSYAPTRNGFIYSIFMDTWDPNRSILGQM